MTLETPTLLRGPAFCHVEQRETSIPFPISTSHATHHTSYLVRHANDRGIQLISRILSFLDSLLYTSHFRPHTSFATRTIVASSLSLVYCLFSILYFTLHTSDFTLRSLRERSCHPELFREGSIPYGVYPALLLRCGVIPAKAGNPSFPRHALLVRLLKYSKRCKIIQCSDS